MNEEPNFQQVTNRWSFAGPGSYFYVGMGRLGAYAAPGVVGDAHIRARGQLTASCCGVILGRISRLGCGPAGNPHTREAEEGNLRGWQKDGWRRTGLIELPPCDHWVEVITQK